LNTKPQSETGNQWLRDPHKTRIVKRTERSGAEEERTDSWKTHAAQKTAEERIPDGVRVSMLSFSKYSTHSMVLRTTCDFYIFYLQECACGICFGWF
jgi:hypothetical protein